MRDKSLVRPSPGGLPDGSRTRIKNEAWEKIESSPLMGGCAKGNLDYLGALFAGHWDFVYRFPSIIAATFTTIPSEASLKIQKFLRRSGGRLAGTLKEMERDEKNHRVLWENAASIVGLDYDALVRGKVLPEIDKISTSISEAELQEKLLAFVAVEIVAEGISRCLHEEVRLKEIMGTKGMAWFKVHVVHANDGTTHEDIAYNVVFQIYRAKETPINEKEINRIIQKYVDLFIEGAEACRVAFTKEGVSI